MSFLRVRKYLEEKAKKSVSLQREIELVTLRNMRGVPIYINGQWVYVDDILAVLRSINDILNNKATDDKLKLALEEYKLSIIQSILSHLNYLSEESNKAGQTKKEMGSKIVWWLKVCGLILISLIGLVEGCIDGFLGATKFMADLIPNISNGWLIGSALAITAINVVLFIAFEVGMLKKLVGVSTSTSATKIMDLTAKQSQHLTKINSKITDGLVLQKLTLNEYQGLSDIVTSLNEDLGSKKVLFEEYEERPFIKAMRWIVTGLGAVLCGLGSYFGAASMLAYVALPLVGTPVGWIIIGVLVASALVFYISMQGRGMLNLFNPLLKTFNHVKAALSEFIPRDQEYFKKREPKETVEILKTIEIFKIDDLSENICKHHEQKANKQITPRALSLENPAGRKKANDSSFFSSRHKRPAADALIDYEVGAVRFPGVKV